MLSLYFSLLKKQTETNFTWWDLTRIFLKTNQLKPGQIKTINFGKTGAIEEKELADKSRILQFNYLRIDELSQELFSDKAILAEEASVIILNGSSFSGLANNIGRMVKNLGAELISTSDAQDNLKKSMIYYHDQKIRKNYTFIKLTKIFPMAEIKKNEQIEGDITFVLGEDFKSLY